MIKSYFFTRNKHIYRSDKISLIIFDTVNSIDRYAKILNMSKRTIISGGPGVGPK